VGFADPYGREAELTEIVRVGFFGAIHAGDCCRSGKREIVDLGALRFLIAGGGVYFGLVASCITPVALVAAG